MNLYIYFLGFYTFCGKIGRHDSKYNSLCMWWWSSNPDKHYQSGCVSFIELCVTAELSRHSWSHQARQYNHTNVWNPWCVVPSEKQKTACCTNETYSPLCHPQIWNLEKYLTSLFPTNPSRHLLSLRASRLDNCTEQVALALPVIGFRKTDFAPNNRS